MNYKEFTSIPFVAGRMSGCCYTSESIASKVPSGQLQLLHHPKPPKGAVVQQPYQLTD